MLQVSHLTRRYGNFVAVNNASFSIETGEIVGLLGHNGAGKTTIMKMLSGYLEPDAGSVVFNGHDLATNAKSAQQDLGYLPESLPVYPEMRVADYLDYAAQLKGIPQHQRDAEIKRVVHATDIAEKLLEPIYTLSRGFKQRVGVAQAIIGKPKLLILDEPTNGLDPTQTEQMRALIKSIAKEATVILSTHILQEVDAICDRVLILNRGLLAVDARLEELRESKTITLKCSLSHDVLTKALQALPEAVTSTLMSNDGEKFQYRLSVEEGSDTEAMSANIAKAVINNDGDIYQLSSEKRDLESLFKEVSQGRVAEEVKHAA